MEKNVPIIDKNREDAFWKLIKVLDESGVLPHVMIMGSWAQYLYSNMFKDDYRDSMRTRDIDILYRNINIPNEKLHIFDQFSAAGYVYVEDPFNGLGKFVNTENELEVEFLTRALGKGSPVQKIKSLDIKAESMQVLNILDQYPAKIQERGFELTVPEPAVFVIQKILTNPTRTPAWKKEKDIEACVRLLEYIYDDEHQTELFNEIYKKLSKKQNAVFEKVTLENDIYVARELVGLNTDYIKSEPLIEYGDD